MNDDYFNKDRLLRIIDETQVLSIEVRKQAQQLTESANEMGELAARARPLYDAMPDDGTVSSQFWKDQAQAFDAYNRQAKSDLSVVAQSSSAASATAALTTAMASPLMATYVEIDDPSFILLRNFLSRPGLANEVCVLMHQFGLNLSRPGKRSALDALNEALVTAKRPATDVPQSSGILLAARESINITVSDLLMRRPEQELARKPEAKMKSLGSQCGINGLVDSNFDLLGRKYRQLQDKLSAGKGSAFEFPEALMLLDEVLHLLKALLSSLDPNKFRSTM